MYTSPALASHAVLDPASCQVASVVVGMFTYRVEREDEKTDKESKKCIMLWGRGKYP